MNNIKLNYFQKEDILHLVISDEMEANSIELSPNITAELNDEGELIGVEIIKASAFIRDSILESTQAKLLNLTEKGHLSKIRSILLNMMIYQFNSSIKIKIKYAYLEIN